MGVFCHDEEHRCVAAALQQGFYVGDGEVFGNVWQVHGMLLVVFLVRQTCVVLRIVMCGKNSQQKINKNEVTMCTVLQNGTQHFKNTAI